MFTTCVLKKKGTSQNQSSIDHDASCEHLGLVQTDGMWLGRIVLEAIKLFASWEGYVDEENQDDMIQDEQNNPILLTNRLLGKSGIIPLLSRGVNQSLNDLIQLTSSVDRERFRSGTICKACLDTSHSEATALLSLVDNASLLNESNRRLLCEEDPFSFEKQNKGLVYSLLNAAKGMHEILSTGDGLNLPDDSVEHLRDMSVLTLRTLNSITHENGTAAEQMVAKNKIEPTDGDASFCGLNVVANLFYELEGASAESLYDSNHRFDAMNSCLISLTNIVGAAEMDVRKLISELEIPTEDESWLQWLCRWMINQTGSFQDAILGKDQKSEGDLHSKEEERLLAAGFACFLLASLMVDPSDSDEFEDDEDSTEAIRKVVYKEMPLDRDDKNSGPALIINTLKAFCNLYHHTVGDLSVAVLTPAKKLIDALEKLPECEYK